LIGRAASSQPILMDGACAALAEAEEMLRARVGRRRYLLALSALASILRVLLSSFCCSRPHLLCTSTSFAAWWFCSVGHRWSGLSAISRPVPASLLLSGASRHRELHISISNPHRFPACLCSSLLCALASRRSRLEIALFAADGAMIQMQRSLSLPGPAHASPRTSLMSSRHISWISA
jgi:hypothetical protein